MKRFHELIRDRLKELGWTYEELGRRTGVAGVYVSRIVQGRQVPSEKVIVKLAETLGLPVEELVLLARREKAPPRLKPLYERMLGHLPSAHLGGEARFDNISLHKLGHGVPVPVVGMVQAGEFMPSEDGGFPPGVADGYVYTDRKGRNLFAVRVVNDSMEPDFKEGDILVVNPNLEPQSGDYVIAKLVDENEVTFKKLMVHDRLLILRPLNPRYEDIVITDLSRVQLVGKVVERKTLL